MLTKILVILIAYCLGSIPTAYLLVKKKTGSDIRNLGSGNVGSTNTMRVGGKKMGIAVFAVDVLKGFVAVWVAGIIGDEVHMALAGVMVVAGHMFPLWLNFKGGKGVATFLGVALAFSPWLGLSALAIWAVALLLIGYVSVASCLASLIASVASFFTNLPLVCNLAFLLIAFLIIIRHSSNFKKIAAGKENFSKLSIRHKK